MFNETRPDPGPPRPSAIAEDGQTRLILPWHHEALQGWLILEMHHLLVRGVRHLCVGMGRVADGACITAEAPDDRTVWWELIRKAAETPAPTGAQKKRWEEEIIRAERP